MANTIPDAPPLLQARGISKAYPGVQALDRVEFELRAGETHALLGENGAGKSTLINVLTGAARPDSGEILLDGKKLDAHSPGEAERAGIAAVHQEIMLAPNLSVAENILLGRQPTRFGLVHRSAMNKLAHAALDEFHLDIDVSRPLGSFSVAIQQIVAIARAVDLKARVLVLDEPTASLDAAEVEALFALIAKLNARGVGVVFVTHFLDQVFAIADRITVLRNGALVGTRQAKGLTQIELIEMMLGRKVESVETRAKQSANKDAPLLARFSKLGRARAVEPFSLELHAGEVVGAAGLLGSGRTETALLMFGALPADCGEAEIEGKRVRLNSPRDAIANRIGFCPEDRKIDGTIGAMSVRENIILALQARRGGMKPLPRKTQNEIAERLIKALGIKTADCETPIAHLSGGNQQKALLARWLATEPKLLLLDEPTRGVDVGAHAEILSVIAKLCADGMAVYLISSEIDELVAIADRVSIMRERKQVETLAPEQVSPGAIIHAIAQP